ncbi:MAG: ComF family protein [Betaproteobacteria bacterium]|nr:MAG: ComF family protein [Betaproteobacteria bacterium]
MLARAAKTLAHWVFGGSCFLCRGAAGAGLLCAACDADLPRLEGPSCPCCALPSPAGARCGRCLAQPPPFDATVAALVYGFPADVLLQALKFHGELALAPLLAQLLGGRLAGTEPVDWLLPVPIARDRLRERGYNQSLEIARPLARAMRVALAPQLCERVRDTPAQTGLPWAERAANVRGAFRASGALAGARVAVLDDVMTTGATLGEIAATLKRAGAASVVNWVVARTLPPG